MTLEEYFINATDAEKYILCIFTLFNVKEGDVSRARRAIDQLLGRNFVDYKATTERLAREGFLTASNYNWRNESYDHAIADDMVIDSMEFLVNKVPDLTVSVLKTCTGLKPNDIQRLLWRYISSGHQNIRLDEVVDTSINEKLNIFLPCIYDERFKTLLMIFKPESFFNLITRSIYEALDADAIIDTAKLRLLLGEYTGCTVPAEQKLKENATCLCDFYDYVAFGTMPPQLYQHSTPHQFIAAIYEAYHGKMTNSLRAFKEGVGNANKASRTIASAKAYSDIRLVNFFYMLTTKAAANDDGRKRALALNKCAEYSLTASAKALYSVLYSGVTQKQQSKMLEDLQASTFAVDRLLGALLDRRINGNRGEVTAQPNFLILKQEFRNYKEYDEDQCRQLDAAYGKESLFFVVTKPNEWEAQLSELAFLNETTDSGKPSTRIAYLMHNTDDTHVEVRQQTVLKNGAWSAGKRIQFIHFLQGVSEGLNKNDLALIERLNNEGATDRLIPLKYLLTFLGEDNRLMVGRFAPFTQVDVTEEIPYITLKRTQDGFAVMSNVPREEMDEEFIITHTSAASINFIHLTDEQRPYYRRLLNAGFFPLEAEAQLKHFIKEVGGKVEINSDLIEGGSTLPSADGNSLLIMQMRPHDRTTYLVSVFVRPLAGGRVRCYPGGGDEIIVDSARAGDTTKHYRVIRDLVKEHQNLMEFISATEKDDIVNGTVTVEAYDLLPLIEYAQQHPHVIVCEWPEGAQMKVKHRSGTAGWLGTIKKNENGWFSIEGDIELDEGKVVSMAQLLELINQSHGRFIRLGDGEFLALSDKLRRQLEGLSAIASRSHGKLQMSPFSAALVGADLTDGELILQEDDELRKIRQRIKESSEYQPEVPAALNATLRNYQLEGYRWMARLNRWGAGALLADDMGLGKTVQTITFLLSTADKGPAFVLAPASVAPNWMTEMEKFAPSLKVTMLNYCNEREKTVENAGPGDVIISTYGLLLSVEEPVVKKHWATVCLDEAHIIKNRGAKTSAVAMRLKSDNRVMLTGTPVQNHLGELWNLFQFVNPGLLGSFEDFNRRFIVPIEQNQDTIRQANLDRLVKPFMLRRTKDKVAKELPEKQEIYQHVELSEEELLVYEAMRRKAELMLMAEGAETTSMNALAEITRLRQCACDTRLVEHLLKEEGEETGTTAPAKQTGTHHMMGADAVGNSGVGSKIIALLELLQGIIEGGGHTLVFSQFTSYLTLIRQALTDAKIPYFYIDGGVPIAQRQKLVERFQDGECPVFLISLKAGGLGLNLTRANYVIHMDPWWNPAIEAQATDRAHRIGQKNAVTVYHFIAAGTIEEKIQRLHERKKALADNILESTDMSYKLTGKELLEMVRG